MRIYVINTHIINTLNKHLFLVKKKNYNKIITIQIINPQIEFINSTHIYLYKI